MSEKEKNLKILLVDDDVDFRKTVSRSLKIEDYEVTEASNGKEAQNMLRQEKVDLVISDIRMPTLHGLELLHYIKRSYPSLPVILMTGFSEVIEISEAFEIGAAGFLNKPFSNDDLLEQVSLVQNLKNEKGFELNLKEKTTAIQIEYMPIPINEFVSGSQIKFPIFLKLGQLKYVKIANEGEDLSSTRISELRKKGIDYFFIKSDNFKELVGISYQITQSKIKSSKVPLNKKLDLINSSNDLLLEHSFNIGVDSEIYDMAVTNVKQTLSLITDKKSIYDLLENFKKHSERLYTHSLGVALISLLICKEIEIESPINLYKVSMAAFFHDIGQKEIPKKILDKSRFLLTKEEQEIYQGHPQMGAEMLMNIDGVPNDLPEIVMQHHENWDGTGFPTGLSKQKIHPFSRIIRIADEFCNLEKSTAESSSEVMKFLKDNEKIFEPKVLKALQKIYTG